MLMKLITARIKDLQTLYVHNLRLALNMEQELTVAIPKMVAFATDRGLAAALDHHRRETEGHVAKVQRLIETNSTDKSTETCKAVRGLTTEAVEAMKDAYDLSIRDVAIIGAAQQVEHHEIAVYGTLRHWAEVLGLAKDAEILQAIENDEINADKTLTEISNSLNLQAAL
jgi:ferritin-like metal-binding protein YciE